MTELNPSFQHDSQKLNPSSQHVSKYQLILFGKDDSKNWTSFSNLTQRIEPFSNLTQRIELFPIWHKELNFKGKITQKIEALELIWLKELNWIFFLNMAQRFCSLNMTLGIDFFTITPRIELFSYDSKNCF